MNDSIIWMSCFQDIGEVYLAKQGLVLKGLPDFYSIEEEHKQDEHFESKIHNGHIALRLSQEAFSPVFVSVNDRKHQRSDLSQQGKCEEDAKDDERLLMVNREKDSID